MVLGYNRAWESRDGGFDRVLRESRQPRPVHEISLSDEKKKPEGAKSCRECDLRGYLDRCKANTTCFVHNLWYVEMLRQELAEAKKKIEDLQKEI